MAHRLRPRLGPVWLCGCFAVAVAAGATGSCATSSELLDGDSTGTAATGGVSGGPVVDAGDAGGQDGAGGDSSAAGGSAGTGGTLEGGAGDTGSAGSGAGGSTNLDPCNEMGGPACPAGQYCSQDPSGVFVCVDDTDNQCTLCLNDAECPNAGDVCAVSPNFDRFCARDCTFDGSCPTGFSCVSADSYGPGGGTGMGTKLICVPPSGESCPCDAKRDGATRRCSVPGDMCEGTETCNGMSGAWENCTAGTPTAEVCDGADNDCNGSVDDGPDLCASLGNPANASVGCNQGACVITMCDDGWTNFPPSLPVSAGCPCREDSTEPNDDCTSASAVGSISDADTTPLLVSGRLSSASDVDWLQVDTVDSDEGTTNSYHINVVFASPTPNDEFTFDIIRGSGCTPAPDAAHSGLVEYDWCVNGTGTGPGGETIGEESCGPTAPIQCGPHDTPYLIAVRRKPGAAGSCQQYQLAISARGMPGDCDFTSACDPQVDNVTQ